MKNGKMQLSLNFLNQNLQERREFMTSDNLLGDIFEECIPLFIALGDRTRLTILQCLFETQTTGESRIPWFERQ